MHLRRVLPLLAAVTVAGLAAFGCAEQSAGVRVGDDVVSENDILDELDAYGTNEALFTAAGESPDALRGELRTSYQQSFVSEIVQQRITFMLAAQIFEDEGLELSDGERQAAAAGLAQQMGEGLDAFPDAYREAFVDDVARYNRLATELGEDEFRLALVEKASNTDIEVSSRFGEWNEEQLAIDPPPAPRPAPGGDATTGAPVG